MPPRALRRCTVCQRFHAAYQGTDPQLGRLHLCLDCWKARQRRSSSPDKAKAAPRK